MKKIVVSAIVATLVTVGTYLVARAFGASGPAALFVAFVAVAVAGVATTFASAFVAATVAVAVAVAVASLTDFADFVPFTLFVVASFVVAVGVGIAEQEYVRFRWAFAAYLLEAVAIGDALMMVDAGESITIAFRGVLALLALWGLWCFAPKSNLVEQAGAA